jgi:hypothetical protein
MTDEERNVDKAQIMREEEIQSKVHNGHSQRGTS